MEDKTKNWIMLGALTLATAEVFVNISEIIGVQEYSKEMMLFLFGVSVLVGWRSFQFQDYEEPQQEQQQYSDPYQNYQPREKSEAMQKLERISKGGN